jgi:hypothetical protein
MPITLMRAHRSASRAACLALFAAVWSGTPGHAQTGATSPLLDYAVGLRFDSMPDAEGYRGRAAAARRELERDMPPASSCSSTLGAARYAAIYGRIGSALSDLDDNAAAAAAFRDAVACSPRDASLHGSLCTALLNLGRDADARGAGLRGLAIDARNYESNICLAELDYSYEDWRAADQRFRTLVELARDDESATYWQIRLWLTQARAGVTHPQLMRREPVPGWPRPILDLLRGGREQDVLRWLRDHDDADTRLRERLCEALYYTGQWRLALDDEAGARRYFAAAINLKVTYFVEYGLARQALRKLGPKRGA